MFGNFSTKLAAVTLPVLLCASCSRETVKDAAYMLSDGMTDLTVNLEASTRAGLEKLSDEKKIYSADLYVYRDGKLESYARQESPEGTLNELSVRVSYGRKDIKVITNIPEQDGIVAGRLSYADGPSPADLFSCNAPGHFVHYGKLEGVRVAENTAAVPVTLDAAVARVSVNEIRNELPASLEEMHIRRVFLMRVRENPDGKGEARWFDGNDVDMDSDVGRLICASVDATVENGASYVFPDGGLFLYAHTNTAKEAASSIGTDDVTKLVVEAEIDGSVWYYPVGLPGIQDNTSYDIDVIHITRTGSDEPNRYLTEKALGFSIRMSRWDGSRVDTSYTGDERYLEINTEGTTVNVRSYEAGLLGTSPISWTATVEVSRDGGETWEETTLDALPWLAGGGTLSGKGSVTGEPMAFTRDVAQVTYPFRVNVMQEGGRTASAVLSRPEYACTGLTEAPFRFSVMNSSGAVKDAGEVIPAANGCFHAELPEVTEGWGWSFRPASSNEENSVLLTVDSVPKAATGMTSARRMFYQCTSLRSVADFPKSFQPATLRDAFNGCYALVMAPYIDTSKGEDFENFMFNCRALTGIPEYDFSSAKSLTYCFRSCESLQRMHGVNSGACTSFAGLFMDCHSLGSIKSVDTKNGTEFYGMFMYCKKLQEIPALDTAKGEDFMGMFQGCELITGIPMIDTSSGTVFKDMFLFCYSLRSVPALNTSKGTNFGDMFNYCVSLTESPALDTSSGTNFSNMFNSCVSLTRVPELNLAKATKASMMFYNNPGLVDLGGLKGLSVSVGNLTNSRNLSNESLGRLVDGLAWANGQPKLTIGSANLAKLSDVQKTLLANKGWLVE